MTWQPAAWLELAYMEHLPMNHMAGHAFGGVFGVRRFDDKRWSVTHIPSGLNMGMPPSKANAVKLVDIYMKLGGSLEFWAAIKKQPERATSTPEFIAVMEACAKARKEFVK